MLRQAHGRGLDCVRGDTRKLPFIDNSLNVATVVDVFHHMPNQRSVTEEVSRVPTSGEAFAISESDPETLPGRGLVAAEWVAGFGSAFATSDELVRFPECVGFEAAVVRRGFEYTVVEKKRGSR